MKKKLTVSSAYVLLTVIFLMKPAYAYLDPGTGSILLQGLIAAIAGGLAAGGIYWTKVKNFFSIKRKIHDKQTNTK